MKRFSSAATVGTAFCLIWTGSARGAVLCQKKSGVVVVRNACRKKEAALDLTQLGLVGPPGPAGSIEGAPAAGDLTGSYPAPTIAAAPVPTDVADNPGTASDPCAGVAPQDGIYCGTAAKHWMGDPYTSTRIKLWRDRLGTIHIRGAAALSSGVIDTGTPNLFRLPAGNRPAGIQGFPVAIGEFGGLFETGTAMLIVYPNGVVSLINPSLVNKTTVLPGDIQFRTDA
jgi:hypothetical protein